jgi:hypothetical protein
MLQLEASTATLHEDLGSACVVMTALTATFGDGSFVKEGVSVCVKVSCLPFECALCGACNFTETWKSSESDCSQSVIMLDYRSARELCIHSERLFDHQALLLHGKLSSVRRNRQSHGP